MPRRRRRLAGALEVVHFSLDSDRILPMRYTTKWHQPDGFKGERVFNTEASELGLQPGMHPIYSMDPWDRPMPTDEQCWHTQLDEDRSSILFWRCRTTSPTGEAVTLTIFND